MISAWWLLPAIGLGAVLGLVLFALLRMSSSVQDAPLRPMPRAMRIVHLHPFGRRSAG